MGYIGKKPTPVPLTASDVTDGIISNAKLAQDVISAETELAVAPATTDEFLISDAGTLKRIDYSLIKSDPTHVLLETQTISSGVAQVDFTSNIDSTYKNYMITITNMHVATDSSEFRMRFFTSIGIRDGAIYDYGFQRVSTAASNVYTSSENVAQIQLNASTDNLNEAGVNGRFYISDPASTTFNTHVRYQLDYQIDGDQTNMIDGVGRIEDTAAVTGVRFYMSSGNIDSGLFKLYGVN